MYSHTKIWLEKDSGLGLNGVLFDISSENRVVPYNTAFPTEISFECKDREDGLFWISLFVAGLRLADLALRPIGLPGQHNDSALYEVVLVTTESED